ncbi:MAG: tetratricopeptide repeat protein [Candidatus Woesearchaeota archaeon]
MKKEIALASILFSAIASSAFGYTVKEGETLTHILKNHKGEITNPHVKQAIKKKPGFSYFQMAKEFPEESETLHPGDEVDVESIIEKLNQKDYRVHGFKIEENLEERSNEKIQKVDETETSRIPQSRVIEQGDTYWEIASDLYDKGYTNRPVTEIVDKLKEVNGYDPLRLEPGNILSFEGLGLKRPEPQKKPMEFKDGVPVRLEVEEGDTWRDIREKLEPYADFYEIGGKISSKFNTYKTLPPVGWLDISDLGLKSEKEIKTQPSKVDPQEQIMQAILNNDTETLDAIVGDIPDDRIVLHSAMFKFSDNYDMKRTRLENLPGSPEADRMVEEDLYSRIKEADYAHKLNLAFDLVDVLKRPTIAAVVSEGMTAPLAGLSIGQSLYEFISQKKYLSDEEKLQMRYCQTFLRFYPESDKVPEVKDKLGELLEQYANTLMDPALKEIERFAKTGQHEDARMLLDDLDYHMGLIDSSEYEEKSKEIRHMVMNEQDYIVDENASPEERKKSLEQMTGYLNGGVEKTVKVPSIEPAYRSAIEDTFGSLSDMASIVSYAAAGAYDESLEDILWNAGKIMGVQFAGNYMHEIDESDKELIDQLHQGIRECDDKAKTDEMLMELGSIYSSNRMYLEAIATFEEVSTPEFKEKRDKKREIARYSYFGELLEIADKTDGWESVVCYSVVQKNDKRDKSQYRSLLGLADAYARAKNYDVAREYYEQVNPDHISMLDIKNQYLVNSLKHRLY